MRSRTAVNKIRHEEIKTVEINPEAVDKSRIGYCRVSTKDQQLNRQTEALKAAGCYRIYSERISGKNMERPALNAMLDFIRDGDTVIVSSLDRLSRNYLDIKTIVNEIESRKASLEILDLPKTQTGNPVMDRFLLDVTIELMGFVAQNERQKIRARQAQGIAIAKREGKYKGRTKIFNIHNPRVQSAIDEYKHNTGHYSMAKIAERHGMSRSSLYRVLKRNHLK